MAVVTDSTADIPAAMAEERDLRVVPMTVAFGERSFISGVTMTADRFYEELSRSPELPTTSQPNPGWFEEAYADAADGGAEAVVSVHLSSDLSGTCELARQVARAAALPVTVVDSRQVSGGLALAVLGALRAAQDGADADRVAAVARQIASATRLYFAVDSLDYLRKGGRLSGPQAFIGSVLRVKPILTLDEGKVAPLEKVRTWSGAVDRLAELAHGHVGDGPTDVVVTHGSAPERVAQLRDGVARRVHVDRSLETVIGPVIGSHAGPGAVGVAVAPSAH